MLLILNKYFNFNFSFHAFLFKLCFSDFWDYTKFNTTKNQSIRKRIKTKTQTHMNLNLTLSTLLCTTTATTTRRQHHKFKNCHYKASKFWPYFLCFQGYFFEASFRIKLIWNLICIFRTFVFSPVSVNYYVHPPPSYV